MKHLLLSKRWFTSLLLTLVITLSWAYDFEENGLYYNINTDETSVSLTYKSMTEFVYEGYVEIPKTTKYRGRQYNVKAIGDDAFAGCENLRGVTLPDGIISIGSYAFAGCEKLLSIEIPKNVSTINDFAFNLCPQLTTVIINSNDLLSQTYSSEKNIGTIFGSQVEIYVIGEDVMSIGDKAFYNCANITSVGINSNAILSRTYSYSSSLKDIFGTQVKEYTIGSSVTSIGDYAFSGCTVLTSVRCLATKVPNMGNGVFYLVPQSSATLHVPFISLDAYKTAQQWKDFGTIKAVDTPDATAIALNKTEATIGLGEQEQLTATVSPARAIQSVSWTSSNPSVATVNETGLVTAVAAGTATITATTTDGTKLTATCSVGVSLSGKCGKTVYFSLSPDNILTIYGDGEMFDYQTNTPPWSEYASRIKSIVLGSGISSISTPAFRECSSLVSISVDASNTVYDSRNGCDAIIKTASNSLILGSKNTTIPNTVTSISEFAFNGCSGLTSILIPYNVTNIANNAFSGCTDLTLVTINSTSVLSSFSYYHRISDMFGDQVKKYIIGNSVKEIAPSAFSDCPNLVSVELPYALTSIGSYAFSGCTSLSHIQIPNSVTKIDDEAFYNCSSLTSIEIPNGITDIGWQVFAGCSGLETISVDASNGKYDSRNNCNAIIETSSNTLINGCNNTVIPNGVTSIAPLAFENCSGLSSVTIPESVTRIGEYAFRGCSGLPIEGGVRYADTYLVEAAYKDQNTYSIKEGTRFIGEDAFKGCSYLSSISIPESVTSVGKGAFAECPSLPVFGNLRYADTYLVEAVDKTQETYVMRNNTKFIGALAFDYCTSLTSIVIPESVRYIDAEAFSRCSVLDKVTSLVTSSNRKAVAPVIPEPGIAPDEIANLYPFNPAHPDDPTTVNVDETTGVTTDNVFLEDECKAKWLAYYKKVYFNRQATSKANTKWTNLSRNPYIMRNESQVVLKATYVAEWLQYQQSKEQYDVYSKFETIPTPQVAETGIFETGIPSQATLYVFENVIDAYRITSPWSEFGQILPIDPLAVEELKSDKDATFDENAPIYDLMGHRLQQKPASGYYIQGGKKFFVK